MMRARDAITIERAVDADIDTLAALFDAYRRFYGKPPDIVGARRYLAARIGAGEAVVFLAYLDGRAAGFTTLYPAWSSTRMARMWVLNDLFVNADARGQGIGGALLARARRHAGETGACEILLETAVDNPARRLYERAGYRQVDDFVYYVLDIAPDG